MSSKVEYLTIQEIKDRYGDVMTTEEIEKVALLLIKEADTPEYRKQAEKAFWNLVTFGRAEFKYTPE